MLWIAAKLAGKDPLPARFLAYFPKGAIGAGLLELSAAGAPNDLDARTLATARIVASSVAGCPFCIDMNAATWQKAGLSPDELYLLLHNQQSQWHLLGRREYCAARYAVALSQTPVEVDPVLIESLKEVFSAKDIVVLANTISQVNYWSRFNQGLGIPSAGYFDDSACPAPKQSSVR